MGIGKLFVVSGPSGVGKTTLLSTVIQSLQKSYPIVQALTYTTRLARAHEEHGRDYLFITQKEFKAKIRDNFFLEWSDAYGAYYGSSKGVLQQCSGGTSTVLVLNWQGALQVYEQINTAVLIWLTVSDLALLRDRLIARNANSTEEIQRRLVLAGQEIAQENEQKRFKYHVLNDDFIKGQYRLSTILSHELRDLANLFFKE